MPIGALMAFGKQASGLLGAGQHGSTFGGNPLAAVAGLVTLETISSEGLLENAQRVGEQIAAGLRGVESVAEVRQYGLHIGVDLDPVQFLSPAPAKELVTLAREEQQLIINATGDHTVRLAPPLILSGQEADLFLTRFGAGLRRLQEA